MNKQKPVLTKILAAAAEEFAQNGLEGARVDQIAKKAGVNKASLYYHVGGKEALYQAAFAQFFEQVIDDIESTLRPPEAPDMPPQKRLRLLVRVITNNLARSKHISPIILREIAGGGRSMPKEIIVFMGRVVSEISLILKEGQKAGIFIKTDPLLTHLMIAGGVNFYLAGRPLREKVQAAGGVTHAKEIALHELGDRVADLILNGVMSKTAVGTNRGDVL